MVAVLMFLAVISVGVAAATCTATCDDARKAKGECFSSNGYVIEVVKDGDNFPQINTDGNSVFKYKITRCDTRLALVSLAGILIPECSPPLGNPIAFQCSPISCTGQEFFGGSGDPLTGFGFGLTTEDTWRWNWLWPLKWPPGLPSGTGTVSITMPGKVYASVNPMMVAVGLPRSNFPNGQILAPSCGLVTPPTFPPIVPQTTLSEVSLSEGHILCLEFGDNSGCPTNGYTCASGASGYPCACTGTDKQPWVDAGTLSDLQIPTEEMIKQVSTKPDARCPITYLKVGPEGPDPCNYVITNGKAKKVCY
jgi:hypothetical protein